MLARVAAMRCRSPSAKTALTLEKCALSSVACCRHQQSTPSILAKAGTMPNRYTPRLQAEQRTWLDARRRMLRYEDQVAR